MGRQQDEEHDWGLASACIQHDEYHFHGTDDVLQALGEHCPRKNLEIPREQGSSFKLESLHQSPEWRLQPLEVPQHHLWHGGPKSSCT